MAVRLGWHAREDRGQINSPSILGQIIRPTRIHYRFVGDELATTFGLFSVGNCMRPPAGKDVYASQPTQSRSGHDRECKIGEIIDGKAIICW